MPAVALCCGVALLPRRAERLEAAQHRLVQLAAARRPRSCWPGCAPIATAMPALVALASWRSWPGRLIGLRAVRARTRATDTDDGSSSARLAAPNAALAIATDA